MTRMIFWLVPTDALFPSKLQRIRYDQTPAITHRPDKGGQLRDLLFMAKFDVLTIGNAIVDIIARCDDAFLTENTITKGAMNLIDAERAELLYSRMGPALEASGGSAGNTAAGVASLGGRAAFFGKVSRDQLGEIYAHDIHAQGVAFDTEPLGGQPPTARSMIFVTPDGERSMNTYL